MKCPFCANNETKVIDSRETENEAVTRRRRECEKCGKRFTTFERIELPPLIVIKKDGSRAQFDRKKVEKGLLKACEKRPISYETILKMVSEIESELMQMAGTEIKVADIGELVMKKLKETDKVAYIRFASVYREFEDISSFEKELKQLKKTS